MSAEAEAPAANPIERRRRHVALGALGLMMLVFIVLSAFSFVGSRDQVKPETIQYAGDFEAVEGKRVFQAYNCMGCHTIVGNGAYFGPDLTNIYEDAGPAWLAAYLPSAATWPTEAALRTQLQNQHQLSETGLSDLAAYYEAFPAARDRIERRGGAATFMPNLPLTGDQINQLIAFLKYTSAMDTEGWPPEPKVNGLLHPLAVGAATFAGAPTTAATAGTGPAAAASTTPEPVGTVDPVAHGAEIAQQYGCLACHATDDTVRVGPGWGGLFGATESLEGGDTVLVDEAYLAESIREPDARLVAGFQPGTMPAYANVLDDDEVDAIVAYIRSLETR